MTFLRAMTGIFARLCLVLIFAMSAIGNKIPNFSAVAGVMGTEGVPFPQVMLAGAIVFLIAGSVSVLLGYNARFGALLLLIFLALATYYFHDFWTVRNPAAREQEVIAFMKNLSLMGAMLLIMVNGPGAGSFDDGAATKRPITLQL